MKKFSASVLLAVLVVVVGQFGDKKLEIGAPKIEAREGSHL